MSTKERSKKRRKKTKSRNEKIASAASLGTLGDDPKKELVLWVAGLHRYMVPPRAVSFPTKSGEIFDLILFDGKKTFKKVLLHPSLNHVVASGVLRERSLISAKFEKSSFSDPATTLSPLSERNARPYLQKNKYADNTPFLLTKKLVVLKTEWEGSKECVFPSEADRKRLAESNPIIPNANYISQHNDNVMVWHFHEQEPLIPEKDEKIRSYAGGMSIRDVAKKLSENNGEKFQCTIVGRIVRKSCLLRFGDGKSVRNVCPFRSIYDVNDNTGKIQVSFWGTRSMQAHATLKIGDLACLKGIVHEYNGVLELKVSTPYGALTRFELEQVPQEFSGSNSLVSLNLLGSWNTYRIVPDTKPDSVPLDYCGVVSFCGPIRNVMNMDARSGAATSRRIQYRWIKIRDHISNYELCLKVYANCESNWDINFRIDHLRIGMFLLFTDLVISSTEESGSLGARSMFARTTKHTNVIRVLNLTQCQNLPFVRNPHLEHSVRRFLNDDDEEEKEGYICTLTVPSSLEITNKIFLENVPVDLREEKKMKSAMKNFQSTLRFKESQLMIIPMSVEEFKKDEDDLDIQVSILTSKQSSLGMMISATKFEFDIFQLPTYFQQFESLSKRSRGVQGLCRVFAQALSKKDWMSIFNHKRKRVRGKRKRKSIVSDSVIMTRIMTALRKIDSLDLLLLASCDDGNDTRNEFWYSAIQAFKSE